MCLHKDGTLIGTKQMDGRPWHMVPGSWFTKAAKQGLAMAQCDLGLCYDRGEGVPQSKELAVEWYRAAANQGNAQAQYNLALCYYNGEGVPKNRAVAASWFRKAANQGDIDAAEALELMPEYGKKR